MSEIMTSSFLASSVAVRERWDLIRLIFLDRIWLGMLVMAFLAVPASVSRTFYTGWKLVYAGHLLTLVIVVTAWLYRRHLSFNVRAITAIVMMNFVAITGVTTFGLLGSTWWWFFLAALVGSTVYSLRVGIFLTLASLGILFGAGLAFINGWLELGFDANGYALQYSSWLTVLLGSVTLATFVFWAISTYQIAVQELLQEVDRRREQHELLILQLQQALGEIKTLRGFIPICAHCKKIRDDAGYWESIETFMQKYGDIQLSHALCPPCGVVLYGEQWLQAMKEAKIDLGPEASN